MKKIALISAIALSGLLYNTAKAQVRIHVGFNFGPRPVYVPARVIVQQPVEYSEPVNYDGDEDYYYLPEVDAYYSVPEGCYYYNDGSRWMSAAYLPGAYRDYNWRTARRYEVRAPRPYMHHDYYRSRFGGVAFNGRWSQRNYYHGGYAYNNHRNDSRRFDNNWGNGYNHQYDQRNDRNRRGQEHFAENMPRYNQGDHRPARF